MAQLCFFHVVMWYENKAGVPDNLVVKMKLMANLPDILKGKILDYVFMLL